MIHDPRLLQPHVSTIGISSVDEEGRFATPSAQAFGRQGKLQIEGICKSFRRENGSSNLILNDISFSVGDAECFALVGGSGTGKTTLLSIIAGLTHSDAGQVLVDGNMVVGPSIDRGLVFQQYAVFPWLTVRKNIEFGLRLRAGRERTTGAQDRRARVDHYLNIVGLSHVADELPKTLSGGMKQRVAIARAYAVQPSILLMDEPFGALDAQTRERMQEELVTVMRREQRTVVFVTHSVEEALFLGDRVGVLRGSPAQLVHVSDIRLPTNIEASDLRLTPAFVQYRRQIEGVMRDHSGAP